MSLRRQDVDRLLAPEFLAGLATAPVADLRARRDECQRAEVVLSYLRRVLQGELDLMLAELELRSSGAGGDIGRLIDELPSILALGPGLGGAPGSGPVAVPGSDSGPVPGPGASPSTASPAPPGPPVSSPPSAPLAGDVGLRSRGVLLEDLVADALSSELLDDLVAGGSMMAANASTLSDDEIRLAAAGLRRGESELSRLRRAMHERIDEIQGAIVERYKTGALDVDSLLR